MVEFTHVLCPTDLSEGSLRPLAYAAALARWYKAQLTVLHVVPSFEPIALHSASIDGAVQLVYPTSRADVLDELRRLVDAAGATSRDTTLATEAGDPPRTIVSQAAASGADLLVIGTHGRSGFERFMVGSIAERVLRSAPCPVLTVPPHVTTDPPAETLFKHVLCAVDFSLSTPRVLAVALDLARQAGGAVTLLHAIEWLSEEEPRVHAHFNVPEYRQYLLDDARHRVHSLIAAEPQTWSEIREVVVSGRAHREILRAAAHSTADLIVMGAQGHGGVGTALFGSTTQYVVRGAACPVLTVRSDGARPD